MAGNFFLRKRRHENAKLFLPITLNCFSVIMFSIDN